MNKPLISIEELKQIALREIHTYPGCEDVSAVGIYPSQMTVVESNWSVQVVSGEGVDQAARRSEQFVSISVADLFVGRRSAGRPGLDFASVSQASDSGSGRT